jgi:hypothetical protein
MLQELTATLTADHNPVLRAEFRYQRFVIQRSRAGWVPILLAALMIVPALLISIGYSIALLLNLIPPLTIFDLLVFPHQISGVLLIVVNISMYLVVNGVTFGLSSSSIGREKSNQTWHLLRMTAVENHQIVFGKWWASLRALNGDHIMVMILRVGLLAYCCGVILPIWLSIEGLTAPVQLYFIALLPFVALQCLLDGALTAAAGVAASMPDAAAGIASGSGATAGRIMLAVAVGIWFVGIITALHDGLSGALLLASGGVLVTLVLLLVVLYTAYILIEKSE